MSRNAIYVGRVGALAVALGVGMAVASTPSVACASPASSGSENAVDESPGSGNAADSTQEKEPTSPIARKSFPSPLRDLLRAPRLANAVSSATTRLQEVADSFEPTHVSTPPSGGNSPGTFAIKTKPTKPTTESAPNTIISRTVSVLWSAEAASSRGAGVDRQRTPVVGNPKRVTQREEITSAFEPESIVKKTFSPSAVNVNAVAPAVQPEAITAVPKPAVGVTAARALPTTIVKTIASVANVVLGSLSHPAPRTPPDSPVMWAVLAVVRREFLNQRPEIKSSVSEPSSTGQVLIKLNRKDADGDELNYTATTNGTKGTVALNDDGRSFTYTPKPGATGTDTVTVTATEASADTIHGLPGLLHALSFGLFGDAGRTATKTVTVTLNTPPELTVTPGQPDPTKDGAVTVTVVAKDQDHNEIDFDITQPAGAKGDLGQLQPVAGKPGEYSLVYTPTKQARHDAASETASDPEKVDTFTVTITDGRGGFATRTVTVAVAPDNAAPAFSKVDNLHTDSDGIVTGTVVFTDADNDDRLTYSGPTKTGKGKVDVKPDGSFTYTPDTGQRYIAAGAAGAYTDTFTVTASDGHNGTTSQLITVTITKLDIESNPEAALTAAEAAITTNSAELAAAQADFKSTFLTYLNGQSPSERAGFAAFLSEDDGAVSAESLSELDKLRLTAQAELLAGAANAIKADADAAILQALGEVSAGTKTVPPDLITSPDFQKLKEDKATIDQKRSDLLAAMNAATDAQTALALQQSPNAPVYQRVEYTVNADRSISGKIYFVDPNGVPIKISGTGIDGSTGYFDQTGNGGGNFFVPAPTGSSYSPTVTVTAYAVNRYEDATTAVVTLDRSTPTTVASSIPAGDRLGAYSGVGAGIAASYDAASAKYKEAEAQRAVAEAQNDAAQAAELTQQMRDIQNQIVNYLVAMQANDAAAMSVVTRV